MQLELARRTDYAIQALVLLAHNPDQTLSSVEISKRTHVPVRFASQVMGYLVRAKFVTAVIGRSGGYRLSEMPERVSVLAIVEAVEGETRRKRCVLRSGPCQRAMPCEIHDVFSAAQEALIAELAAATLADVAAAPQTSSRTSSDASPGMPPLARGAGD